MHGIDIVAKELFFVEINVHGLVIRLEGAFVKGEASRCHCAVRCLVGGECVVNTFTSILVGSCWCLWDSIGEISCGKKLGHIGIVDWVVEVDCECCLVVIGGQLFHLFGKVFDKLFAGISWVV